MHYVKYIFLILSMLSSVSALEKGVSARKPNVDPQVRRGLKKSKNGSKKGGYGGGYVPPNRGGGMGNPVGGTVQVGPGVNRDGTTVGQLIEPPGKPCIPFDEARKWLTEDYPGDIQCRVEFGQMQTTTACCRVFSFTDTNGPQKWLLYDTNNQYRDLMCVCNENTAANNSNSTSSNNNPVIPVPNGPAPTPSTDRTGGVDSSPITAPTPTAQPPVAAPVVFTGPEGVCDNPNPTQLALQDSPYMVSCKDSSPCGDNKCCFSNYCVCWPVSQLVEGTSYCL